MDQSTYDSLDRISKEYILIEILVDDATFPEDDDHILDASYLKFYDLSDSVQNAILSGAYDRFVTATEFEHDPEDEPEWGEDWKEDDGEAYQFNDYDYIDDDDDESFDPDEYDYDEESYASEYMLDPATTDVTTCIICGRRYGDHSNPNTDYRGMHGTAPPTDHYFLGGDANGSDDKPWFDEAKEFDIVSKCNTCGFKGGMRAMIQHEAETGHNDVDMLGATGDNPPEGATMFGSMESKAHEDFPYTFGVRCEQCGWSKDGLTNGNDQQNEFKNHSLQTGHTKQYQYVSTTDNSAELSAMFRILKKAGESYARESDGMQVDWWDSLSQDERINWMNSFSMTPTDGSIYMDNYDEMDSSNQYYVKSLFKFVKDNTDNDLLGRNHDILGEAEFGDYDVKCSKCEGSGKDGDEECDRCDGSGKIEWNSYVKTESYARESESLAKWETARRQAEQGDYQPFINLVKQGGGDWYYFENENPTKEEILQQIDMEIDNWKSGLYGESYASEYKVGDYVRMTDDAIDNYGEQYRDKEFRISHVAKSIDDHMGYDEGVGGNLYDFDELNFSLYDYELE